MLFSKEREKMKKKRKEKKNKKREIHVSDFHSHTSNCPNASLPNAIHSPEGLIAMLLIFPFVTERVCTSCKSGSV